MASSAHANFIEGPLRDFFM